MHQLKNARDERVSCLESFQLIAMGVVGPDIG